LHLLTLPPDKAAEFAAQKDIIIYTIAIGDPNTEGNQKLDEETLQLMAEQTGGQFFRASDRLELAKIYDILDKLQPQEFDSRCRLDRQGLEKLNRQAGSYVTYTTLDNSDVKKIYQHVQKHLADIQDSESDRWKNEGYWLVYPLAGLILLWFRRGWTIQWSTSFLLCFLISSSPAMASPSLENQVYLGFQPSSFVNLWLTPDQQGRWLVEHGKYAEAAERFANPLWQGVAYYLNEDFESASEQFSQIEPKTAEIYFNLGNAYAQQEDYKNALKNAACFLTYSTERSAISSSVVSIRFLVNGPVSSIRPSAKL
jgi:hypothetical protein